MITTLIDARGTRRSTLGSIEPTPDWDDQLMRYRGEAVSVLATHEPADGRCTACRALWPCARVLAADFVIGL